MYHLDNITAGKITFRFVRGSVSRDLLLKQNRLRQILDEITDL